MDLIGFGYAALVTIGSVLGYKRRGGVPSLIAGLSVGLLAGYGAYRVSNDRRDVKVSLFTAFFLATIMGVRFKRSKKVMPAGLVAWESGNRVITFYPHRNRKIARPYSPKACPLLTYLFQQGSTSNSCQDLFKQPPAGNQVFKYMSPWGVLVIPMPSY
uniref:Transmembrane protein 14A n=1 Tax=Mus spicilegus TaxID=10103 RepID=A0A8C6GLF2_MUSSI